MTHKLNFIGCNTTYHTYMENHGFADLSNNPISNCFRSLCRQLLRSGSITGQNIEYKMENSPLFLEVSRSHLEEGARQRLLCMSVLRFILCDGSYSFPDQPGFFPDEPRSKCFKPFTARLFQRSDIFHPLRQHPYCQKASGFHLFQNGNQKPEANSGTHSFLRQIIFTLILFNHEKKGVRSSCRLPFSCSFFTLAFLLALPGFLFFRS